MGINLFNFLIDFPFRLVLICKSAESKEKINQTPGVKAMIQKLQQKLDKLDDKNK